MAVACCGGRSRCGDMVLLATETELVCWGGEADPRWKTPLEHAPVVGRPLVDAGHILLASGDGFVTRIEAASGKTLAAVPAGEPLSAGPVPYGDKLLVAGQGGARCWSSSVQIPEVDGMKSELSCGSSSVTVERLLGRGSGGRRAGPAARRVARTAIGLGVLLLLVLTAWGQEEGEDEGEEGAAVKKVPPELLERAPFFQITLDAANENAVIDIMPLESVPVDPKPTDRLRIRLLDDPDQLYDVLWEHIVKLRTYEQLVFDKAQSLIAEKKYDEAFRYFDYLLKNTQVTAGLQRAVLEYLLTNGATCVDAGEFTHGLAILEELTSRDKNFRRAEVEKRLAQVCDKLIRDEVDRGDFRKARGLIERLRPVQRIKHRFARAVAAAAD